MDMDDGIEIEQASLEDVEMILQLQMRAYLSEAEIYNDYSIPPLTQPPLTQRSMRLNRNFHSGYF